LSRDITYLGRGVSGWLNERVSDVARLQSAGLPVLSGPADVAKALGISLQSLRGLAFHAEVTRLTNYLRFTVPKRSGGQRELSVPHRRLAAAQRWILRTILDRLIVSEQAHGFVSGRGVLTNAQQHCGQAVLLNLDVQNFFPSISFARVRRVFMAAGYSKCVATILALVCTGLHQSGAVQSCLFASGSQIAGAGDESGAGVFAICGRPDVFRGG